PISAASAQGRPLRLLRALPACMGEPRLPNCVWRAFWPSELEVKTMSTNDKKQNLQDTFLNSVRRSKTPLTIFLVNGVKLQGVVSWFDNFCVLLRRDGQSQLVYKHAISTIMPAQPVQLYEPAEDETD